MVVFLQIYLCGHFYGGYQNLHTKKTWHEHNCSKMCDQKLHQDGSKISAEPRLQYLLVMQKSSFSWLKSVPGEPNRAFCLYCNRSLHAHCLSLLKHLCTLKHTRAAQAIAPEQFPCDIGGEKNTEAQQNLIGSEESGIEAACQQIITNNRVSVEQNMLSTEGSIVAAQKQIAGSEMSTAQGTKKGISTHVLDTAKGKPANGLQVSLYRLMGGKWTIVSEGYTDEDGRFSNFLQDLELCSGRYKLHFDVDRYFDSTSQESLYPFVEIAFDVKSQQDHYHIPLLLSPFGYTTYRGS
ncbi:uncharacterized protein LOC124612448 isoform X1 [Schistocerca americana]|uniref:uncharacterized protein LOC124612448 isoform X1 n=1 Tax=Schistocerca americana TaxID=7009 RepID=UPI001F4F5A3D|nr:uncharacterized protein LOC124612448 isoform X1 [Schistocerca americana]